MPEGAPEPPPESVARTNGRTDMPQQSPEELLRANIEAFNASDFEAYGSTFSEDCIYDEPGTHRRFEGRHDSVGAASGWKAAFSDVEGTIESIISSGNTAVAEITWRGTHDGGMETPDGPIAPTGNQITVENHYFDLLTLLTQIDAVKAPYETPATAS